MRPRALLSGALLAGALLVASGRARGAPRVAIVVGRSPRATEARFETQLRAELLASGFDVLTAGDGGGATPEALEALAERTGSVAAIAISLPRDGVAADVWITDRVTGKTLLRHVRPEEVSGEAASVFALRAVELLRASLLEIHESHPTRGDVAPPAEVHQWIASSPPRAPEPAPAPGAPRPPEAERETFEGFAGAALLGAPGDVPAGASPSVALAWRPTAGWALELRALGPAMGTIRSEVGSAAIDQELVTAGARLDLLRGERRVVPFVVAGAGLYHLGVQGTASGAYVSGSGSIFTFAGTAGAGARIEIARRVGLTGRVEALLLTPRPVVRFAGRDASSSTPIVLGTVGVDIAW